MGLFLKRFIALLLSITLISIALAMSACKNWANIKYSTQIYSLDTIITLTAYGSEAKDAVDSAVQTINYYDNMLSVTNNRSEIAKINNSADESVQVNDETASLISSSLKISDITNGSFDITVYPVVKLWGFTTSDYYVPSNEEILNALANVDYKNLNVNGNVITKTKNLQIDLGGIAKGYISQKVCEKMQKFNIIGGVVNLGGNVQCFGVKDDAVPFCVGVEYPNSNDCYATITINDAAAITSGAYQRNFTKEGKFYHHIINPATGYPAVSDIESVTVVSDNPTFADGLSTALYIMGVQEAVSFYKNNKDLFQVIILSDDKVYVSAPLKDSFNIENNYNFLKVEEI